MPVRAKRTAVEAPMPAEAPVMRTGGSVTTSSIHKRRRAHGGMVERGGAMRIEGMRLRVLLVGDAPGRVYWRAEDGQPT